MDETNDHELLAEFARNGSEPAFATLVTRYVNLVHSAAFRFTSNADQAEEITQAVFIILARKAGSLSSRVVLSGWLYQVARLTAANFMKGEIRRQRREQEAHMQSLVDETEPAAWNAIAPLLEQAMGTLGQTDRDAVVLRYFENKSAAEIGAVLRMNEEAARRRVNRAVEKLRKYFSRHGVDSSASIIAGAIAAHSVQAAPVTMVKSVTVVAIAKGAAASASTLTLIQGALKVMAWTKAKTAVVVTLSVLLAAGTATMIVKKISQHPESSLAIQNPAPAAPPSDSQTIQGSWSGREIGVPGQGSASFVLQGSTLDYHGADPREWYQATFSLKEDANPKQFITVITACPAPNYVGKTSYAIYKIEGDTLTICGNEPGDPAVPARFGAPGTRTLVFKKK